MQRKSNRVRVNLYIDRDIVKLAKERGLNLSEVSENALREKIKNLQSVGRVVGSG